LKPVLFFTVDELTDISLKILSDEDLIFFSFSDKYPIDFIFTSD